MAPRYRAAVALTLALTLCPPPALAAAHAHPSRRAAVLRPRIPVDEIYSRRALRRARTILELKLLELRGERLERVRKAIETRTPIEELLKEPQDRPKSRHP